MRITLELEMLEPNLYSMCIFSGTASEMADVKLEEVGDVVNDFINVRKKELGLDK